jgi:hypothetical protein
MAMSDFDSRPLWVGWINISVVNKETRVMGMRSVYLDLMTLPPDQQNEITGILKDRSRTHEMIRFRALFKEVGPQSLEDRQAIARGRYHSVGHIHGYHEDEQGRPLDDVAFVEAVTGWEGAVVLGNPRSVTRRGPSEITRQEKWTVQKSNDIAHFLELAACLSRSDWLRSVVSFTHAPDSMGGHALVAFETPDVLVFNSVLVFIRQLLADKDRVFWRATDAYLCHVADGAKRLYVTDRRDFLKRCMRSPDPLCAPDTPSRTVLDLFMYGFGLIHRYNPTTVQQFNQLLRTHGREKLVMALHGTLQQVAAVAINVSMVVAPDFAHWISTERVPRPDRIGMEEVFDPFEA